MTTTDRLMPAVDRIYAAAAREISLDAALAACADAVGDRSAALFLHDGNTGGTSLLSATGVDVSRRDAHNRRWNADHPLMRRGAGELASGRCVNLDELVCWDDFVTTDYYREFFAAFDCRHGTALRIAGGGTQMAWLLGVRGTQAGPHTSEALSLMDNLRPHLARALQLLGCFAETVAGDARNLRQMLDNLPLSLLLVDGARRVVYANRRAQARLRAGDGIVNVRGRVSINGPDREAFENDWSAMADDPQCEARHFALRNGADARPFDLEITRFAPAAGVTPASPLWQLRLRDAPVSRRALCTGWVNRFGFTATECKVGLALLERGDAASIAAALRIADNTVRAHLKTLFAKAGVRNQAALALALSPPLRMVD